MHYLRAEFNNLLMRTVRRWADVVVYQSHFARGWWEREASPIDGRVHVVHNGVPLDEFYPAGPERPPDDRIRIGVAEGRFGGGYELGLEWAVALKHSLATLLEKPVELSVAGDASEEVLRRHLSEIHWRGRLETKELASLHRSSHFLFSSDLHPACPNSVLEALACGCPVAAFDTGAISEIVTPESGVVVEFGTDPWEPGMPAIENLARALVPLTRDSDQLREGARERAEAAFSVENMTQGYLNALGWG
jgi:glycosyltransferase involved in cell wall biosynthesis